MSTLVTFFKSDAMAESFPDENAELVVTLPENAQLTYAELRDTRSGEAFAFYNDAGEWVHRDSGTHWSDVVIGNAR